MIEIKAAFASMRPTLWIGIALNVIAASAALQIFWNAAVYITICLCLSSAFSFLINDFLDRNIDHANHVERPRASVWWSLTVAVINASIVLLPIVTGVGPVSYPLAATLLLILALAALYSMAFAKVVVLKNILAAVLATSPLWACLLAAPKAPSATYLAVVAALGGYILAREIKFDQFDSYGDRIGGRMTLPHVVSAKALDAVERALTVVATAVLLVVAFQSPNSAAGPLVPAVLAIALGLALYIPLREKQDVYYTTITRVAMIVSPLYVISAL
ncbi:UbiA family prenyltransferase [Neorhizobium galegae]|nr:UbiA family prenyltransferase [Neorhizobium galegae]